MIARWRQPGLLLKQEKEEDEVVEKKEEEEEPGSIDVRKDSKKFGGKNVDGKHHNA